MLIPRASLYLFLFYFIKFVFTYADDSDASLSIQLIRQKSPLEQHINSAKKLRNHGFNVDWIFKKPSNRTNDSVALYRYHDNEFYAKIIVGHPGQSMNVAFDTAWTLSWLISDQCPWTSIGCLYHNKYDHSKSSGYKKDGTPINIPEGSYNLSGFLSYDNFYIGHSNVTSQLFAEITNVPKSYIFSKIDGVLGLGLQTESDAYVPIFYNLLKQGKIKDPLFSIYLNRDAQSEHGGNIILGFIEYRHVHSKKDANNHTIYDPIKYLPLKAGAYWQFDLDGVYFNGDKDNTFFFCNESCTAISDTSGTSIYGPKDQVDKIHVAIKARQTWIGKYTVACETINKLPDMAFVLGGQNFTLKGRDYTIKMTWHSFTFCVSAFIPSDTNNMWVLGGAFLSEYYSIYDIGNKQIGFVKAA
ncbi:lysosomal aspartic protease-like [Sitophilus oryzae]|uniref:Lysosomal aspartic protease-like n=1 Tax=Sitophilus oryzae TaxID=7048 RepID=A0A6J2YST4_SITOR|nr:lysosomal aspartic protease-like [Sitophilus oryzae]